MRGIGTSDSVELSSTAVNKELDEIQTRVEGIFSDSSRSTAEKIQFLKQYRTQVRAAAQDTIGLLQNNIGSRRTTFNRSIENQEQLAPHVAVMLADSLKNADPAKRVAMVNSDPRLHGLLKDLGPLYFDLSEKNHQNMLEMSANAALSDEQREEAEFLSADETQLESLKERRESLLKSVDGFIESNAESVDDKRASTDHLYQLD